jgi:hypothetical protein
MRSILSKKERTTRAKSGQVQKGNTLSGLRGTLRDASHGQGLVKAA